MIAPSSSAKFFLMNGFQTCLNESTSHLEILSNTAKISWFRHLHDPICSVEKDVFLQNLLTAWPFVCMTYHQCDQKKIAKCL